MTTPIYPIAPHDVETLADCPACGSSDDAGDVARVRDSEGVEFLTTVVCRRCGLIYRRRRPTLDWFCAMWARRDEVQARAGGAPFNPEVEQTRYRRYAETARIMGRNRFGRRVLDVGSGPATGLRAFAEAGFHATGLEPDASRARFADAPGVEIIEATIERFAADTTRRFDAVTCQHSLEHFHQPRRVLELIARLLEVRGLAYVEVPDARQSVRDFNDALYLAHLSNFAYENLSLAGRSAGLEPIGRENPPADEPGETHLAIIFQKTDARLTHREAAGPPIGIPGDGGEAVRRLYRNGLPAVSMGEVLSFVVPEINDISLTFKGDPRRVDRTVRANFAGRGVRYDPEADEYL